MFRKLLIPIVYKIGWVRGSVQAIWLELRHYPTDGRLDYCRCGESWPCSTRQKFEELIN